MAAPDTFSHSNRSDPMVFLRRRLSVSPSIAPSTLPRLAIGAALLLVGLLLTPDRAQAQQNEHPHWTQHFDAQVAEVIKSSNPSIRTSGMHTLIKIASEDKVAIDLPATRAALCDVLFDRTYSEDQRILALSALHAVDDSRIIRVLAQEVDDVVSARVRRHVLLALRQHM